MSTGNHTAFQNMVGYFENIALGGGVGVGTVLTATAAEINALASSGLSTAELAVLDGVTPGTAAVSKALVLDANKGVSGFRSTGTLNPTGQAAANALNATGTQTAAMMLGGIITSTSAAAVVATLDTGTLLDTAYLAAFPGGAANDYIEWSVVNTGSNSYTQATAGGWTDGGNLFVAVATATSARFGARRTAANAWTGFKVC